MSKKLYISVHGGEGWENIIEEHLLKEEIDDICKHWKGVAREDLLRAIYVFPIDKRIKIHD